MRLTHESLYHEDSCFVTLTYDDENLPQDAMLKKTDLISYIKRLRERVAPRQLKYFACGEYGEEGELKRPHYHGIIFGLSKSHHKTSGDHCLSGPVKDAWPHGFVTIAPVIPHRLGYVTKYIQKKLYGPAAKEDGREQPFSLKSNGLGRKYLEDHEDDIRRNKWIWCDGKKIGLPRYYVKALHLEDVYTKIAERRGRWNDYADLLIKHEGDDMAAGKEMWSLRHQKMLALQAKEKLYRSQI